MHPNPPLRRLALALLLVAAAGPARADDPAPTPVEVKAQVKRLVKDLRSDKEEKREAAARELGTLGPAAKDAVPVLTEALEDKAPQVRLSAAVALLRIDQSRAKEALAAATAVLKDPSFPSFEAWVFFDRFRPVSKEAVEGLRTMLYDDNPLVNAAAVMALENVGPEAKEAAGLLADALKDRRSRVRLAAAGALIHIDPEAGRPAVAVVREALKDADYTVRVTAADLLVQADPAQAAAAVDALKGGLKDRDAGVRLAVAGALVGIDPAQAKAAVPVAAEALASADKDVRVKAAAQLARFGRHGAAAEKALRAAVADKEPEVGVAAAEALVRILPEEAGNLLPALAEQRDRLEMGNFADLLKLTAKLNEIVEENIKGQKRPADRDRAEADYVTTLIDRLEKQVNKTSGDLLRVDAAARLAARGPKAKDAVVALARALDDPSVVVRSQAAFALGKVGPDARDVAPLLAAVYQDRKFAPPDVRQLAGESLKQIDPAAAKKAGVP
jgi:HEAT repeat protein